MTNCEICSNQFSGNYCSNCGKSAKLKRIDKHYVSHELLHLLHFEKGFFYTVKELLVKPGVSIREFIGKNRDRHMKPVPFLILTALLFTLVLHFTHADEIYNDQVKLQFGKSSVNEILHWMQGHHGYGNLIEGIFIALSVRLFYRKYKYNIFEIIILLCFVIGQGTFLLTLATLFFGILNQQLYQTIIGIVSFGYSTWAIGQFFDGSKIRSYIKSFFVYLLGYIMFFVTIIIVGLTADLILKTISN